MRKCYCVVIVLFTVIMMPAFVHAAARLDSVTSVSGGCLAGPTGGAVEFWDVEPGETYHLTINNVFECANGGTDATLNVRVNSEISGNTDLVATIVSPGVYEFDFTVPADVSCTMPIFYCTTPGDNSSGLRVIRKDGVDFQVHLRASTFEPVCMNPTEILGPFCLPVPAEPSTWGKVKALYN